MVEFIGDSSFHVVVFEVVYKLEAGGVEAMLVP